MKIIKLVSDNGTKYIQCFATSKKLEPIDPPMARLLLSLFNDQNYVWFNGLLKPSTVRKPQLQMKV